VAKLGISEEALQAWKLVRSQYLVIILSFPHGYRSLDKLCSYDQTSARRDVEMRVGVSNTYKPSLQEAYQAFRHLTNDEEKSEQAQKNKTTGMNSGFKPCFVSRPMNDLLNSCLLYTIEKRFAGMPWSGAEMFYNDIQGMNLAAGAIDDKYYAPEETDRQYPRLVTADHITECESRDTMSFPLIAMQFLLRHFVRCTEFCLVCHRKLPDEFEAIKPYVCENQLCLYQYISLGFGPSIEHEIMAQPYVVDLLISFCYTRARSGKLTDLPNGLSLSVPGLDSYPADMTNRTYPYIEPTGQATGIQSGVDNQPIEYSAKFDEASRELLFESGEKNPFRLGDWIVVRSDVSSTPFHCRVSETNYFPTVRVSPPIIRGAMETSASTASTTVTPAEPVSAISLRKGFKPVTFSIYNGNFDELSASDKREAMLLLMDMLPSVHEMKEYLTRKASGSLSDWTDRLSPAALGVLRWIVATCRACIMQVDDPDNTSGTPEERLWGMNGFMQFRFAMGAPDKERRFINSVRETQARLKQKHSTIFAWHGSALHNWHSIIREGLHYNYVACGRAYGDGVYHSLDHNTSMSYAGIYRGYGASPGGLGTWPNSCLKVSLKAHG